MSVAEKFEVIADAVYEKGIDDGVKAMWGAVTNKGERTYYASAFQYWGSIEYIRPQYKIKPVGSAQSLCYYCTKLKKVESDYFDLSGSTNQGTIFARCSNLEEVEDIKLPKGDYNQAFIYCEKLKKIALITVDENTKFNSSFGLCSSLEYIRFDGVVGQNISFKDSPLLTDASLENIAEHLKEFSSPNSAVLTLHATVKNRIEGTPIYSTITGKGWTIV